MLHGYGHVKSLCKDLQAFMSKHGFTSIEDFRGYISYRHFVVITWAFCVWRTVSLLFLVPRLTDLKPIAFFLNNLLLKMAFEEVSDRFLLQQQHWIPFRKSFDFFGVRARILQTLLIISYSLFECEPTAGLSLPIAYRNVTGRFLFYMLSFSAPPLLPCLLLYYAIRSGTSISFFVFQIIACNVFRLVVLKSEVVLLNTCKEHVLCCLRYVCTVHHWTTSQHMLIWWSGRKKQLKRSKRCGRD